MAQMAPSTIFIATFLLRRNHLLDLLNLHPCLAAIKMQRSQKIIERYKSLDIKYEPGAISLMTQEECHVFGKISQLAFIHTPHVP